MRDELDGGAQLGDAEHDQDEPRHDGGHDQPIDAELLDDPVDDHHERAGRAADLDARAAECRNDESGDDGGVQSAVGANAAGDCERYGEGESNYADDHTGDEVGGELGSAIRPQSRN